MGIYGNYGYNSRSNVFDAEDHNSTRSNYTLRVMPYDGDLRENFIDLTQPSCVPIYLLLIAIIVMLLLF